MKNLLLKCETKIADILAMLLMLLAVPFTTIPSFEELSKREPNSK